MPLHECQRWLPEQMVSIHRCHRLCSWNFYFCPRSHTFCVESRRIDKDDPKLESHPNPTIDRDHSHEWKGKARAGWNKGGMALFFRSVFWRQGMECVQQRQSIQAPFRSFPSHNHQQPTSYRVTSNCIHAPNSLPNKQERVELNSSRPILSHRLASFQQF